jgi:hypothetical protein
MAYEKPRAVPARTLGGAVVVLGAALALAACAGQPASADSASTPATAAVVVEETAASEPATTAAGAEQPATQASTPVANNDDPVSEGTLGSHGIQATCVTSRVEGSDALAALDAAIGSVEADGRSVGFVLRDTSGRFSASYNASRGFYPASSMKAPYVCALLEEGRSPSKSTCEECLVESSNDAFRSLHKQYGEQVLCTWLSQAGIDYSSSDFSVWYYPTTTPAQLEAMWEQIGSFVASGSSDGSWLGETLSESEVAPIRGALGGGSAVMSKAGWYPADGTGDEATVDAGIVTDARGEYYLAVMTNEPEDFDKLDAVIAAVAKLREASLEA